MIDEQILDFTNQLKFDAEIINSGNFVKKNKYILHGMGGSALVGDVLRSVFPEINLIIHRSYGIPDFMPWTPKERLHIFSSYSGNTEEILDGLRVAKEQNLNAVVVTSGGRLLEVAKEFSLPYVVLPGGVQPRMALGYFIKALSLLIKEDLSSQILSVVENLDASKFQEVGSRIADFSGNKPFLIYSSNKDSSIGYIWKIKLNENAKHPAFSNSIPEANHNEIEYLEDEKSRTGFFPVFVMNGENDPRVIKRMKVLMEINETYRIPQTAFELFGVTRLERILGGILLADFVSLRLAKDKGIDPEKVSILENFKQKIKN